MAQVKDFMTKGVVSVSPETPIVEVYSILFGRNFSGLPVVDKEQNVVGLLTEYDLITKGTQIHLPTFLKLLKEFDLYKKDKSLIKDELASILKLKTADVMNKEPLLLRQDASIEEAAKTFAEHHRVNPVPVVDGQGKLAGILSRCDILKLYADGARFSRHTSRERNLDKRIDNFLSSFEREFILVSRFRTRFWFIISLLFIIVGFAIAFAFLAWSGVAQ